jgi:hypothetical protein
MHLLILQLSLPAPQAWLPGAIGVSVIGLIAVVYLLVRPGAEAAPAVPPSAVEPPAPNDPFIAPPKEQRRTFRRGGNPTTVHYAIGDNKERPLQGWVVDRSIGGICLMTHDPIAVGSLVTLRPVSADDMVPWIDVVVKSCRDTEEFFELGCQFIKTPPYSILLLFN